MYLKYKKNNYLNFISFYSKYHKEILKSNKIKLIISFI